MHSFIVAASFLILVYAGGLQAQALRSRPSLPNPALADSPECLRLMQNRNALTQQRDSFLDVIRTQARTGGLNDCQERIRDYAEQLEKLNFENEACKRFFTAAVRRELSYYQQGGYRTPNLCGAERNYFFQRAASSYLVTTDCRGEKDAELLESEKHEVAEDAAVESQKEAALRESRDSALPQTVEDAASRLIKNSCKLCAAEQALDKCGGIGGY